MSNDHEWLNLIEVSGPFLAAPVLRDVFPQGLEALPSGRAPRLRRTYEEWRDAVDMDDLELPALHAAWIDDVLVTALEMDETVLRSGATLPEQLTVSMPEHRVTVAPDMAIVNPTNADEPLLLIHVYEPDTDLEATRRFDGLAITPADRMVALLRATGCPIGVVTNGERWMLVHAPVGAVAGFASWYARLWGQEPETLRAFVSLLGIRRLFGPDKGKLPALYERSLKHQDDVTEALGEQVRRAVEVLVQALDRADQDRNRELLRDVDPRELYEAGLTVMMRLVFLLAAEERGLLLLGDPRYDSFYAISSLRMQLRADSEEILERRRSAWSRLLALFRGVYGGIDHPTLRLPALGGSLFDPDRYPFLEGRKKGTNWRTDPAEPLPIDDRTVLLLLEAIQTFEGRTLSYRALDVEQIGHVYEGLLERTVKRVDDVTLELDSGAKAKSPRVTLGEMESARLDGAARVAELLKERSERSESAIRNALERSSDDRVAARLLTVCRGDIGLRDRILTYASLLRTDPWGYPLVHHSGAFVVVLGADRRESGTHYTPKSLTEKIVEETLTPVAYRGPAEGKAPEDWELKSAGELLDLKICDPAMGSGAFLVQACRWLSDRLVEAWSVTEKGDRRIDSEGRILGDSNAAGFEPLSQDPEERAILARRLIAERCLYGVDRNPLAVELAKLSLWLTTMSKGRPFGFLDHNLRSGDSLLGIYDLGQLVELDMNPKSKAQLRLFGRTIRSAVDKALELRARLREIPIRDIHDVEAMAALDAQSSATLATSELIADAFIGLVIATGNGGDLEKRLAALSTTADRASDGGVDARRTLAAQAQSDLMSDFVAEQRGRPFHWPLEFPEVFLRANVGFDAFVGNPPFLGNRLWKGTYGAAYQRVVQMILEVAPGKIDLSVVFHRRAAALLRHGGTYGLLAANNIAEGSAVSVGLERIAVEGDFYFSRKGMPWPGAASTVIAIACFRKGGWTGLRNCDGIKCEKIGPRLQPEIGGGWEPKALPDTLFAFAGVDNSKGLAFVLTEEHPWFERLRSESGSLLRPYITGNDITSTSLTRVERWALDIADLSLETIETEWPIAYRFLIEIVLPTRTPKALKSYKGLVDRWWQFWNHRAAQMRQLRARPQFIAFAKAAKYPICVLAPTEWIYTNKVVLVEEANKNVHPICLSSMFQIWLRNYSVRSLGGDNNTLTLSVSEALATFPFPKGHVPEDAIAAARDFQDTLVSWSRRNSAGMTDAMNAVHSSASGDTEIVAMRDLLERIDAGVADAYGWSGLDLAHGFQDDTDDKNANSSHHGLDEQTRDLVLAKLIELNRQRYQEKVDRGLHGGTVGSGKARGRTSRSTSGSVLTLDLDDILSPTIEGGN
ncbi:Eco57I restriction-modification methylase domain-containing protein [Brevundimonas sp. NPDC003935]|uniref:Eco57I restriction-modification methylase domain-containing protein n=1 Tax=unclassified Brevundimonas TaxID=2622653 RepID=UPI00368E5767